MSYFTITWKPERLEYLDTFQRTPNHARIVFLPVNEASYSAMHQQVASQSASEPAVGLSKTSQSSDTILY